MDLSEVLRDCCCRCAQNRRKFKHLKVFEGCRKECEQEFSEGPEVVERSEGLGPSKGSKEGERPSSLKD
jgi:hypothetical protein